VARPGRKEDLHRSAPVGHIFGDALATTGKRYCMNSASLVFEPAKD